MLFNKSIKKLILASLLIIIPAQTMTVSWPSFSSVQQGASQLFSNMTKRMEKNKIIAAAVIGGCIAIYLGKIYFNRKKAAIRVRERDAFVGRAQLIVESIRQSRDRNNQQEINNEVDRRCFICLCNEDESDEPLLQEIRCPRQNHPGRVHQSCLNQARGQRQRCPICRHEGEAAVERRTGREEMGNDNFSIWIERMQNQDGAAAERRIARQEVENAMLISLRERLQNAYQHENRRSENLMEQLRNLVGEGNQGDIREVRVRNGRILNP